MLPFCRTSVGLHRVLSMTATWNRRSIASASKVCAEPFAGKQQIETARTERDVLSRLTPSSGALDSSETMTHTVSEHYQEDAAEQASSPEESVDELVRSILSSRSQERLLEVVGERLHVMEPQHLLCCLSRFGKLAPREGEFSAVRSPLFESLTNKIRTRLRSFDVAECVQLARTVGRLQLHCSSSLVQGIYQILKRRQNRLDLEHIVHLWESSSLLQGESELTDAFFRSLSRQFKSKVERELDKMDEEICLKALVFAVSTKLDQHIRNFVIDAAQGYLPEADPQIVARVIYGVAFRGPRYVSPEDYEMHDLLEKCLVIIAKNMSWFDSLSIRRIMAAYEGLNICHIGVHAALWSLAPVWNYDEVMRLVRLSLGKDVITVKEAELLRDLLVVHKEKLASGADNGDVFRCSQIMSILALHLRGHDGEFEETGRLLATVLEREDSIQKELGVFVRFMLNLAILGVYPERELDLLFSRKVQKAILDVPPSDLYRFVDLERLLHLRLGDSCAQYKAMHDVHRKAASVRRRSELPADLVKSTRIALGGDKFVLENFMTPMGIEAELAVVVRKQPIAVAKKRFHLKDLPKNSSMIAILPCVAPRHISENSEMPRADFALKEYFLREQKIPSVVIKMKEWNKLRSAEKIQFIKDGVRKAAQGD